MKHDQWLQQSYEHFHTYLSSLHLHEQTPQDYNETLSEKIYFYWKNKRIQNKNLPLIKRIEYVLEQRENAELLIAQINNCLKIRNKIRQVISKIFYRLDGSLYVIIIIIITIISKKAFLFVFSMHDIKKCLQTTRKKSHNRVSIECLIIFLFRSSIIAKQYYLVNRIH